MAEARSRIEKALSMPGSSDTTVRARALTALGGILYWQGKWLDEGLQARPDPPDPVLLGLVRGRHQIGETRDRRVVCGEEAVLLVGEPEIRWSRSLEPT